jgi:hypothetical protein
MQVNVVDKFILPGNREKYAAAVEKLSQKTPKEEKEAYLKEVFAFENGPKVREYDKLQTEVLDLNVQANLIWPGFFEYRELKGSEMPVYATDAARPDIPVNQVSNLGGSKQVLWTDSYGRVNFDLRQHETAKVAYPRWDVVQGFVDKSEKVMLDLNRSVGRYLNTMAQTAITAQFGAFGANTWVLDPAIQDAPTTNDLNLVATCNGRITKDLFKAIIQHFDSMEKQVIAVYVPASRRHDALDFVSVSGADINAAATVPGAIQEAIWKNGGLQQGGIVPPMQYTNILPGRVAPVYVYAIAGPIGYFYQKPEGHESYTKMVGRFWETQNFFTGSYICPAYLAPNIVRIRIL